MNLLEGRLASAPSDLADFLACRHKTNLDLQVALGEAQAPTWIDPLAMLLRKLGDEHEKRYVNSLRAEGLDIVDLTEEPRAERVAMTLKAMHAGVHVIVQGGIVGNLGVYGPKHEPKQGEDSRHVEDRSLWSGFPDVLRRVDISSDLGSWSYEVYDTKLTRETRGSTMLQLCVYSELVGVIQGRLPEHFHVVTPAASEPYRFKDFAASYRSVKAGFIDAVGLAALNKAWSVKTYPDKVSHCEVCRWWESCNARRRSDDHLSFVAGLGRLQQKELESRNIRSLSALARLPLPIEFKPKRGSRETYERLREQARLQVEARETHKPVYELLPLERLTLDGYPTNRGLARLPEPSRYDLFLDLEGSPFAREGGREYLFGLGRLDENGAFVYKSAWAFSDETERMGFEEIVDDILKAVAADPSIHIYHYSPYEPAAFKRLMGRHASREAEIDALLRSERFVDLLWVVKHAIRAGVESYSIKQMEPLFGFEREVALDVADDQRRVVEIALATGQYDLLSLDPNVRVTVEGYNRDDCRSTFELQKWLEILRADLIANGTNVPRPEAKTGDASEKISERQIRVEALRKRLLEGIQADAPRSTPEECGRYLLAYTLDWHRRETRSVWGDYYRLVRLTEEDLLDERGALARLQFVRRECEVLNKKTGKPTGSIVDRYRYPAQEIEIGPGAEIRTQDEKKFGEVVAVDRANLTIDIKKSKSLEAIHPTAVFEHKFVNPAILEDAIYRLGTCVADTGSLHDCPIKLPRSLLLREPPNALGSELASNGLLTESPEAKMVRLVHNLDGEVLAIQGAPGSGKTFNGAKMICSLVAEGKRVGITATSHKVIRNLLDAVHEQNADLRLVHKKSPEGLDNGNKPRSESHSTRAVIESDNEEAVRQEMEEGTIHVLGGTAWLWAKPNFSNSVDVLFVDEAGQMSLAYVLAVTQAANSLVLLGDPQQLEQPQKGSHPDGLAVSALEHILGGDKTMPVTRGLFLPITQRLAPALCLFTSEVFYEGKLCSKVGLERQVLCGIERIDLNGQGLRVVEAFHDSCRNASDEEADLVTDLVGQLLATGSKWTNEHGKECSMTPKDILVVAPYNAHVYRLQERLRDSYGVRVGTVDKFQGQQAPVVIYSMATSRPEDAPRGMEFLYSLNRLNVATSRAKCLSILVASSRLFEPECQTPRQMRLASALCRYRELAKSQGGGS